MHYYSFYTTPFTLVIVFLLSLTACKKEPGEGGTALLSGKVETVEMSIDETMISEDSILYDTTIIRSYPAAEKKIFLIYGEDDIHDDDTRTDEQGRYQFKELYKGKYRLFAYSDCLNCPAGKEPVFQTVEILANGEELDVPPISVKKLD